MKIRLEPIEEATAGDPIEARRFPFALGQAKECDLRIEAKGVWDNHLVLDNEGENGITAAPCPDALVFVNGDAHRKKFRMNHGDLLELGSAKFRFWFAPLGQEPIGTVPSRSSLPSRDDPLGQAARKVVQSNEGAVERTVDMLLSGTETAGMVQKY